MKQNEKLDVVEEALKRYTGNFTVIEKCNPMLVKMNGTSIAIYVENIVKANARGKKRLSTSKPALMALQRIRKEREYDIAVIGVFSSKGTFAAWDPKRILAVKVTNSVMVSVPKKYEKDTTKENPNVFKSYSTKLKQSTYTIAMDKTVLGAYLENIKLFHSLDSEDEICSELAYAGTLLAGDSTKFSSGIDSSENERRNKITYTREAYPRDPRFRKTVLDACDDACCICGRQLDILQAAHIIPYSEESSTNTVENGLAMCPEHHALYDKGLLLPGPDFKLIFNKIKADELRKIEHDKGIRQVEKFHGKKFKMPKGANTKLLEKNLIKGLRCRLGRKWRDHMI